MSKISCGRCGKEIIVEEMQYFHYLHGEIYFCERCLEYGKGMKLENQVFSLEEDKKAKLYPDEELRNELVKLGILRYKHNLAELGEMLPEFIEYKMPNGKNGKATFYQDKNIIAYEELESGKKYRVYFERINNTEANARAKMLIYLIKEGLLENKLEGKE